MEFEPHPEGWKTEEKEHSSQKQNIDKGRNRKLWNPIGTR